MSALTDSRHWLASALTDSQQPITTPSVTQGLQERARTYLQDAALPTAHEEDWRFMTLVPLLEHTYQTPARAGHILLPDISRFILPEAEGRRLTFVDGYFSPELSNLSELGSIVLRPLGTLNDTDGPRALGSIAPPESDTMTALATLFGREGACLEVPPGVNEPRPIHLLFVSSGAREGVRIAPRIWISTGPRSKATVVQTYVATHETVQAVHAITEVAVGEESELTHIRVQSESRMGCHFERCAANLGLRARYTLRNITLGGRLSRFDVSIDGVETEMNATLDGLALLAGDQEADTRSQLIHRKPHGQSRQSQRMILDGCSHAVFRGLIRVHPQAQQTDSAQSSRGLLLSSDSRIDTKPELAIEADDVKCAHGAAIGQLDEEQLFYLRARGISESDARALLTFAFAAEVLENIPIHSLRKQLQAVVLGRTQRAESKK
ncbi:MAG: Fe-S cluster assembly protein SufD [Candidatus Sericytochromatia bacterium]|nr:Fe-S cluster assembly protein SufD [Candidatus Sericytochromatia bacterium]